MKKWFLFLLPVLIVGTQASTSDTADEEKLVELTIKHDITSAYDDAKIKFIGLSGTRSVTLSMKNGETGRIPAGTYEKTFYRIENKHPNGSSVISFVSGNPLVAEEGKPCTVILSKPKSLDIRFLKRNSDNNTLGGIIVYHRLKMEEGVLIDLVKIYDKNSVRIKLPQPFVTILKDDEKIAEGYMEYG